MNRPVRHCRRHRKNFNMSLTKLRFVGLYCAPKFVFGQKRKMCAFGGKETLCYGLFGPTCEDFSTLEMLILRAPALYPQTVFVACDC
jgi:hypothetical protein